MSTTPDTGFQPQGPAAYSSGGLPPQPLPPAVTPKRRNTIAVVAFVVAVVGFIFAVWEGAYLLGWLLLPVAFILSIVALVVKDRPRKLAVTALIVSIVGTVAGGIAFASSMGRAFEESFGSSTPSAALPDPTQAPSDAATKPGEVAADTLGTRENPYPIGATVSTDDWEVTVDSFTAQADEAVLAENPFNEAPAEGSSYALVGLTLKRVGTESGTPFEIDVNYVTASGNTITTSDNLAVAPDAISYNELFPGASVTGNLVLVVPDGDAGVLQVRVGLFNDDVFFATA